MKIMLFSAFKLKNIAKAVCFTLGVSALAGCDVQSDAVDDPNAPSGDLTPPILTLTGPAEVTIESFESGIPYVEMGATGLDYVDGPVSISPTGIEDVDTTKLGMYLITFDAVDHDGNAAETISRTVTVVQAVDRTAPVITLNGEADISFTRYEDTYIEEEDGGATALDAFQNFIGTGVVDVTTSGDVVNNDKPGVYTITYTATDIAGNTRTVDRTVTVVGDPEEPVLTLEGESTMTLLVNRPYREFGANAFDPGENGDGVMTVPAPTGDTVDVTTPGTYTLTYSVTDTQNKTVSEVRTVEVVTLENSRPFVFELTTFALDETFSLKTAPTDDFYINWGEGDAEVNIVGAEGVTNTFETPGKHTVTIRTNYVGGSYDKFQTEIAEDISKLTSIMQWGDIRWYNFQNSFQNSGTFTVWPTDVPDIERTKHPDTLATGIYRNTFNGSQFNQPLNLWDMEGQTNVLNMMLNAVNFNQPLDKWDMSAITAAKNSFNGMVSFDQNLGSWNLSALTNGKNANGTFSGTIGWSVANWDATLVGWAAQGLTGVSKIVAGSNYHSSAVGTPAVETLIGLGWSINDAGEEIVAP
ncbi:MAG: immunoglobulin-like domain-containing protein [Thalassotalea sp.]